MKVEELSHHFYTNKETLVNDVSEYFERLNSNYGH